MLLTYGSANGSRIFAEPLNQENLFELIDGTATGSTADRIIQLPAGTFRLTAPIRITAAHSGQPDNPTIIRGSAAGKTILAGSRILPIKHGYSGIQQRHPNTPVVLDLTPLAGSPLPRLTPRGSYVNVDHSSLELFQGEARLRPARWPKHGFSKELVATSDGESSIITFTAPLFEKWKREQQVWIGGYWKADWAFEKLPLTQFLSDGTARAGPVRGEGKVRGHFPFFIENAKSELSQPGEFVFDANQLTATVLPNASEASFEIAVTDTLLEIDGAHDVVIERVSFEKTSGTTVKIRNSSNIILRDCFVGLSGVDGISVDGGVNVIIDRCVVRDVAETGVSLVGGNRVSLTPSGHQLRDSVVRNFGMDSLTYRPAVKLQGVGNRVEGCFLTNGSHSAVLVTGNENILARNEISHVVWGSDDAGAIYTGRDWTERGNVMEGNFFHDIGMPPGSDGRPSFVSGIYLDDQESGYLIRRNVFLNVNRPVVIHGGRDNLITENAFLLSAHGSVWIHRRGEGLTGGTLENRLNAVPYMSNIWTKRYPQLARLPQEDPASPLNNIVSRNLVIGGALAEYGLASDAVYLGLEGNTNYPAPATTDLYASRLAEQLMQLAAKSKLPVASREENLARLLYFNH
ncbi:right-handed parallel beta-helix repeat-containing protein [Bradyrhizobium lupini]|uniref:right-handed parallel beta-helix repeat-containing protein n=1 Tax=Rhizobium lupini TaxID=136996 RepID=UPI0034C632CC